MRCQSIVSMNKSFDEGTICLMGRILQFHWSWFNFWHSPYHEPLTFGVRLWGTHLLARAPKWPCQRRVNLDVECLWWSVHLKVFMESPASLQARQALSEERTKEFNVFMEAMG